MAVGSITLVLPSKIIAVRFLHAEMAFSANATIEFGSLISSTSLWPLIAPRPIILTPFGIIFVFFSKSIFATLYYNSQMEPQKDCP